MHTAIKNGNVHWVHFLLRPHKNGDILLRFPAHGCTWLQQFVARARSAVVYCQTGTYSRNRKVVRTRSAPKLPCRSMVIVFSVTMNRLLLAAVLFVRVSRAEWVEIPHLKPSSAIASVSSISSTTIKPVTPPINAAGHVVVTHSQRLLSHLADERDVGDRWSHQHGTPVRWHRPISDLLDYDRPSKRVSQPSPWITGDPDVRNTPVALVNVSNKVEEIEASEEGSDEQDGGEQYPVVQTELLPFGNRYEEESIESGTASDGSKAIQSPVQHFDDFDDYDERLSVPQTHAPDSEEPEYNDGDNVTGEETAEEAEEENFVQQTQPIKITHLHPQQPTGFGGFLEFLRRMQASFVQRTAHTIGDKIRTLAGMRDQLLSTIGKHCEPPESISIPS
uniref:Uncharacterized protein n=1 Tax=Anopheles maculatus TaxID=74869 RepID=A0A182SKN1_9DIPT